MLLPHKPKQTYKFKTKNQPLTATEDKEAAGGGKLEEVFTTWINDEKRGVVIQHQLTGL